eukprot:276275-Chlamydomonas_euryale.AAC.2
MLRLDLAVVVLSKRPECVAALGAVKHEDLELRENAGAARDDARHLRGGRQHRGAVERRAVRGGRESLEGAREERREGGWEGRRQGGRDGAREEQREGGVKGGRGSVGDAERLEGPHDCGVTPSSRQLPEHFPPRVSPSLPPSLARSLLSNQSTAISPNLFVPGPHTPAPPPPVPSAHRAHPGASWQHGTSGHPHPSGHPVNGPCYHPPSPAASLHLPTLAASAVRAAHLDHGVEVEGPQVTDLVSQRKVLDAHVVRCLLVLVAVLAVALGILHKAGNRRARAQTVDISGKREGGHPV